MKMGMEGGGEVSGQNEEYVQLTSWDELIAWLEKEGYKVIGLEAKDWNPKPKQKSKKRPPQSEGLF